MKRVSRDSLSPVVVSAISCRDIEDAAGYPEVSGHSSAHHSTPSALVSPLTAGQSVDGRGRACTARGSIIDPKGKREAVGSPKPPWSCPGLAGSLTRISAATWQWEGREQDAGVRDGIPGAP